MREEFCLDIYITKNFCIMSFLIFIFCTILVSLYTVISMNFKIKNLVLYSSYECGFLPYSNTRIKIDINFAAIAVLFIVFDIETIILLPFVLDFQHINTEGIFSGLIFLMFFGLSLFYEINSNILKI